MLPLRLLSVSMIQRYFRLVRPVVRLRPQKAQMDLLTVWRKGIYHNSRNSWLCPRVFWALRTKWCEDPKDKRLIDSYNSWAFGPNVEASAATS